MVSGYATVAEQLGGMKGAEMSETESGLEISGGASDDAGSDQSGAA